MPEIIAHIEDAKARWATGGSAEAACPAEWKNALGDAPDLALLALAGQFTHLAMRPRPGGPLEERTPLPLLALPTLPEPLRADFRRLLGSKSIAAADVVRLIAARGHVVSPVDWLPGDSDSDLPEIYTPWLDWRAQRAKTDEPGPTAETWDLWSPQARLAHVDGLRKTDAAAGRALIEEVAPSLAAEPRLRLVSCLAVGLSDADIPYLLSLQADKSQKVQGLAGHFLARLGQGNVDAELKRELAEFFENTKAGFLSRRRLVKARKLKTQAQRQRRAKLAELVPFIALAEGLSLSGSEVVEAWDFGDGTDEIAAMIATSGSDAEAQGFLERMLDSIGVTDAVKPLIDRIPTEKRPALVPQVIARDDASFATTAGLLSATPGVLELSTIQNADAFRQLEKALREDEAKAAQTVTAGLANLGLLADREAARALLDQFKQGGMMSADPRLAMLRLNADL